MTVNLTKNEIGVHCSVCSAVIQPGNIDGKYQPLRCHLSSRVHLAEVEIRKDNDPYHDTWTLLSVKQIIQCYTLIALQVTVSSAAQITYTAKNIEQNLMFTIFTK